jgi:hypothetical protein
MTRGAYAVEIVAPQRDVWGEMSSAPFDSWPSPRVDPASGLRSWFVAPRIIVMQFPGPTFDAAGAAASVRVVDELLETNRAEVRAAGGLVMMNDLRRCVTVEREGQLIIEEAWKHMSPDDLDEAWVFSEALGFFSTMVLRMVNTVAALRTGKTQHVVRSPWDVLARYGLMQPPTAKEELSARAR